MRERGDTGPGSSCAQEGASPRRVVIVSAVAPFPSDSGKKVVLAGMVSYWCARVGAGNVHYVLVTSPESVVPAMPVTVHRVRRPSSGEQLRSLIARTVLTGRHAIQESMLYSPRVRDELCALLTTLDADMEIFDTIRLGQYVEAMPPRDTATRVVYLDDLFSIRYARMLETLRSDAHLAMDPLGEFRANVPAVVSRLLAPRWMQLLSLRVERRLVARRERVALAPFEMALLVSPQEVTRLKTIAPTANVREFPPTVSVSEIERRPSEQPVFVLLGLLSIPHNHDAAVTFVENYLALVLDRLPDAHVHIVGRGATPDLVAAVARSSGSVTIEGFVPDLDDLFSRATALLVPLRFGSGIKIKVIEALARGLPVVSTPVGAEGIADGPDKGLLVETNPAGFADAMVALHDRETNHEVSEAARRHYVETYAPAAAFRRYDEVFLQ